MGHAPKDLDRNHGFFVFVYACVVCGEVEALAYHHGLGVCVWNPKPSCDALISSVSTFIDKG